MDRNELRAVMFAEQAGLCWLCGRPMVLIRNPNNSQPHAATFDHVVARVDGGTDDPANLKLAHKLCNNLRGSLSPEAARGLIALRAQQFAMTHQAPAKPRTNSMPFTRQWLKERGYFRG